MFILTELKDTIAVKPSNLNKDLLDSIVDSINYKYSNKIIQDLGLALCLHSLLDSSEGFIQHSNGNVYYKCKFNLIIFRPFVGEILIAKVKSTSEEGITASVGFFDDIFIPIYNLPPITQYDKAESTFFWLANWEEDSDPFTSSPEQRAYIDIGENIRIRIEAEHFENVYPKPKKVAIEESEQDIIPTAYRLTASIDGQGLGVVSWWEEAEEEEEEEEDAQMEE